MEEEFKPVPPDENPFEPIDVFLFQEEITENLTNILKEV